MGPTLDVWFFVGFETGSKDAAQAGLELAAIPLSPPLGRWN